jgi:YHS domain-containing protein
VENAFVGPLIAVVSWVCSIGNVPLAAALWSGGISFGGVIAFIFADLIAMPLILIYRKFYGWELTLRIVALFYGVMVIAGLITEGIFSAVGGIPTRRMFKVSSAHFEWNYTTYLNVVFIVVALGVWWLARNRKRFGGGEGYAIDPVCGMQVRVADAPAITEHNDRAHYFCSDRCKDRFENEPAQYLRKGGQVDEMMSANRPERAKVVDPVCGMTVDPTKAAAHRVCGSTDFWFCNVGCAEQFDKDPDRFIQVK